MVSRLVKAMGAAGTLGATTLNLGCCGAAVLGPLGVAATAAVAVAPVAAAWGYEVMYASLALTLLGLAGGTRRHRHPWPLLLALAGTVAMLLASHESWDMRAFTWLVRAALVALMGAVAGDAWLGSRSGAGWLPRARGACPP